MDLAVTVGIILRYHVGASPETVYKTYTDPRFIPEWWVLRNQVSRVDQMDVRPGGAWRYIIKDENGSETCVQGIYHEVVPCQRLVFSLEFEAAPQNSLLEIVTFEALDGKTQLTNKVLFHSAEDRERMLNAGFEENLAESMQRFSELLEKILGRQP